MAAFAVVSASLAVGGASAAAHSAYRAGITAGAASSLPNTNIKGHPAHFKPKRLHAKARWPRTMPPCTISQASFTVSNKENKAELINFTGTGNFTPFSYTVFPHVRDYFCITKGYHGTLTGKLTDGKKLKVNF